MIMDYKTGEWKSYDTKTGTVESKALTFASDLKKITNAVTGADVSWDGNATVYGYSYDKEYNEKIRNGDSIGFDGDKTVYIHTEIAYDVTLTIPVYDAATDSYVAPSEPQVKNAVLKGEVNTGKVGYTASAIQSILTPVEGFAFKQWVDNATGKKQPLSAPSIITLLTLLLPAALSSTIPQRSASESMSFASTWVTPMRLLP